MDRVVSKSSRMLYFAILLVLFLGTAPLFLEDAAPIWVSIIMWALGVGLIFAIRTIEFTRNTITVKFIAGRRPIILNKEDIDTISIKISGDTVAQRTGIMKKDRVLQIRGKEKRKSIFINERFDQSFDQIHHFLQKHYRSAFDRAGGEVM